jgi:hypothetical protein
VDEEMPSMSKRRRARAAGEMSWWERFMFSFMGPPQLGDLSAPSTYRPDPRAELCGRCGQPWDVHERVYGNGTSLRCPPASS